MLLNKSTTKTATDIKKKEICPAPFSEAKYRKLTAEDQIALMTTIIISLTTGRDFLLIFCGLFLYNNVLIEPCDYGIIRTRYLPSYQRTRCEASLLF